MKHHGLNPMPECPVYSEFVPDFSALEIVGIPSARIILLVVADARDVPVSTIARVADRFLGSGLIQVCVWGPDCQRVHDIFDEVHVGDGSICPGFTLMSTWHDDEPLEHAIWYFLQCAFPLDHEIAT